MKVLIVEDELAKITALRRVMLNLKIERYTIAQNREDAKKAYLSDFNIDVLILDMRFPEKANSIKMCTGIDFLRELEFDFEKSHKQFPKTIVYSILSFEHMCKGDVPKSFLGQSLTAQGVEQILMQVV